MHPLPRRILRQLIADYGSTLLNEPDRVNALLADLCGSYHCERFLLIHALRERTSIPNWPVARWLGSCSRRLQNRYCFSSEAAVWAAESWSFALSIASANASHNGKETPDGGHSKLSETPQRTLYQLLADWGPELLNDPGRVDALLADSCGPFPRERFLLFHALRERIPTRLILANALREHIPAQLVLVHAPRERALAAHLIHPHGNAIHASWLSQHLQNRYGFSAVAARWAVESCSFAVNISLPAKNLATAGKPLTFVDEITLRTREQDPRAKAWVSAEVWVRQKAREHEEAVAAARLKAEERKAAVEAVRQKAAEQKDAVVLARQKAEERKAANETARQKAKEQDEAGAVARQKAEERRAIDETVRQNAKNRKSEKAVSLERAIETIAAQEMALTKAKAWVATEAADHQKAKEWAAAEEEVLQKAEKWVESKTAEYRNVGEWSTAKATERQKTEELAGIQAAVLQKTEEWVESKAAEHQKIVEWVAAEEVVLQKIKEWVAGKEEARQKMFEWAAAEKAARVKAEERSAAEKAARVKAEERSAAEKAARVIALEEITLQILKQTPLTSREVAAFLGREHEQAISWLRRLQATGKVESTWLQRSPQHPCYHTKDHSSALAFAGEIL